MMRLLISIATLTLAASILPAQSKEETQDTTGFEAVIIPVKTLSGDSFNRLSRMLSVFNARYTADEKLRTTIVYAPANVVEQMKRVVAELDRPGSEAAIGRNIELTLTFLRTSPKPSADTKALPADLEAVAKQLRAATQYKNIELWDTVPLHLQEGKQTDQNMRLPGGLPDIPGAFPSVHLRITPESVTRRDAGRYVRFERQQIQFRIPYSTSPKTSAGVSTLVTNQFQFLEVGLNTAGEFKEGQKSVLGKVSGDDESSIFVVISLKVFD